MGRRSQTSASVQRPVFLYASELKQTQNMWNIQILPFLSQICLCRLLFLPVRVKLQYVAFNMLPRLILKGLKDIVLTEK